MDNFVIANVLDNQAKRHLTTPEALTVPQLRDELASRGLSTKGKKPELVARLTLAAGSNTKQVGGRS